MLRPKTTLEKGRNYPTLLRKTTTNNSGSKLRSFEIERSIFVKYKLLSKQISQLLSDLLNNLLRQLRNGLRKRRNINSHYSMKLQRILQRLLQRSKPSSITRVLRRGKSHCHYSRPLRRILQRALRRELLRTATAYLIAQARSPQSHASALPTIYPGNTLFFIHQYASILALILNTLPGYIKYWEDMEAIGQG